MVTENMNQRRGTELSQRIVEFNAGDGFPLNLINVQGEPPPTKGPVILVHGAGVRANIFRAPVKTTLVDYLVDRGYDVWLENWRASIDLPPNPWTLDQAAIYDHPEAVKIVVEQTGAREVKAVIHCQGSTSFTMSAIAGLVPQVKTIVSNAVSLHTILPTMARIKLNFLRRSVGWLYPYTNPQWGLEAPTLPAKLLTLVVNATNHECDNPVCKQANFVYGMGPTLWSHENLSEETHEWVKQEFAHVPLTFFNQIARSVKMGHLVPVEGKKELPRDFTARPPETDARFAFFAGEKNRCFLPESQVRSFEYFDSFHKGYHSLVLMPGYGHLDVFMGENAARDVFPRMLEELEKPG